MSLGKILVVYEVEFESWLSLLFFVWHLNIIWNSHFYNFCYCSSRPNVVELVFKKGSVCGVYTCIYFRKKCKSEKVQYYYKNSNYWCTHKINYQYLRDEHRYKLLGKTYIKMWVNLRDKSFARDEKFKKWNTNMICKSWTIQELTHIVIIWFVNV